MSKHYNDEEKNMNDNYVPYQGGYISYEPNVLTEHYTVKGFEGKIEKTQESNSRWC
ncbi:hypothetical protein [Clostridium saccharoperbutylacetonicum]|uniref:hypothetical protein n=1 Tax=Clostridium saccharoperbutylacetonicum TaxID=36745 RepID=UPI0039EA7EA0